jgi:hypothetical protein
MHSLPSDTLISTMDRKDHGCGQGGIPEVLLYGMYTHNLELPLEGAQGEITYM